MLNVLLITLKKITNLFMNQIFEKPQILQFKLSPDFCLWFCTKSKAKVTLVD